MDEVSGFLNDPLPNALGAHDHQALLNIAKRLINRFAGNNAGALVKHENPVHREFCGSSRWRYCPPQARSAECCVSKRLLCTRTCLHRKAFPLVINRRNRRKISLAPDFGLYVFNQSQSISRLQSQPLYPRWKPFCSGQTGSLAS